MKAIFVVGVLAVVGFAVAACGGAKKTVSRAITDTGTGTIKYGVVPAARSTINVVGLTATVPNVKTGIWIRCKGWPGPGVKVPPPGQSLIAKMSEAAVTVGSTTTGPSSSEELQVTHRRNGSIRVVCKPSA